MNRFGGDGIHQCVAALEKINNPGIIIAPMSEVVAEGNIASFYKNGNQIRYGFSGTLGEPVFSQKIADMLGTERIIKMPRAERPDLEEANWPLIADGKGGYHKSYNRTYRFAPIITETDSAHIQLLIEMIENIRQKNQSAIVFFNTIAECEEFHKILQSVGDTHLVQIFDDTNLNEEEDERQNNMLKRSQRTSILHAATPKMITLTTAAGSRGADFNSVSVGIVAAPSLSRVVYQKGSRIGRNAQFGIVYEVYSKEQLDVPTQELLSKGEKLEKKPSAKAKKVEMKEPVLSSEHANLRFGLDSMEASMQNEELKQLNARKEIDDFKDQVQNEYANLHCSSARWPTFFASIQVGKEVAELRNNWEVVKKEIIEENKPEDYYNNSPNF